MLLEMSPERLQTIMEQLDEEVEEISDLMDYPEDSAGGIMQKEVHAIKETLTLAEARESIRRAEDQEDISAIYIYVVDDDGRLKGVLRLRDLLFRDLRLLVRDVMITKVRSIRAAADQEEIANLFQKYNYSSLPVLDDFGKLVGRVTSDDVLDVIQEEATEDMHRMVGISGDETVFTPWPVRSQSPALAMHQSRNRFLHCLGHFHVRAGHRGIRHSGVLPSHRGPFGGNAGNQT